VSKTNDTVVAFEDIGATAAATAAAAMKLRIMVVPQWKEQSRAPVR
jgi:hypothetical protein